MTSTPSDMLKEQIEGGRPLTEEERAKLFDMLEWTARQQSELLAQARAMETNFRWQVLSLCFVCALLGYVVGSYW